jgi:hypothetical protein
MNKLFLIQNTIRLFFKKLNRINNNYMGKNETTDINEEELEAIYGGENKHAAKYINSNQKIKKSFSLSNLYSVQKSPTNSLKKTYSDTQLNVLKQKKM